jgi:hypothetical protein
MKFHAGKRPCNFVCAGSTSYPDTASTLHFLRSDFAPVVGLVLNGLFFSALSLCPVGLPDIP